MKLRTKLLIRFEVWISNWIDILCSLIAVVTFTLWMPSWYMDIRCYFSKNRLNKKIRNGL